MILPETQKQWIYSCKPKGALSPEHFSATESPLPQAGPGEVLVRTLAFSIDPAQRMWMKAATYRPMLQPGEVMASYGIGQVVVSNAPGINVGDVVEGDFGWQQYAVSNPGEVVVRDGSQQLEHLIGVLNITGLTAYFGLLKLGVPRPGETVVISGAAGAVGCIVVQLAKLAGCRVVGIAGGEEKCRWLTDEFGADAAVDYKAGQLGVELQEACPRGVDVYFDNVAGEILDRTLTLMNQGGRIVCCGAVSQYDGSGGAGQPKLPGILIRKRIRMEGFIVFDHYHERDRAEQQLVALIRDEKLKTPVDIVEGIDHAPQALIDLLSGRNKGKMMVKVG